MLQNDATKSTLTTPGPRLLRASAGSRLAGLRLLSVPPRAQEDPDAQIAIESNRVQEQARLKSLAHPSLSRSPAASRKTMQRDEVIRLMKLSWQDEERSNWRNC